VPESRHHLCPGDEAFRAVAVIALPRDEETELCGLRVYGTPWVPFLRPGWAFQAPETSGDDLLAQRLRSIPEGLDVLISHGPPYGVQDTGPGSRLGVDPHAGSSALAHAIGPTRPRLLVCGHVMGPGACPTSWSTVSRRQSRMSARSTEATHHYGHRWSSTSRRRQGPSSSYGRSAARGARAKATPE
jgi:hypothetical protein